MPLQKNNLNINFAQGLDTKTDSKQVQPGRMLALANSIFQKGELLQKRNGFGNLPPLPALDTNTLTTFGGSLVAVSKSLYNFVPETSTWYNKGSITSVSTNVTPLVRSATSQTQQDVVVAPNGLSCAVWQDSDGSAKYQINDTASSQIVVSSATISSNAKQARVFLLGSYFIITFLVNQTSNKLFYLAIPIQTPTIPVNPSYTSISTQITSLTKGYDGVVNNAALYIAFSETTGNLKVAILTATLTQPLPVVLAGRQPDFVSMTFIGTAVWLSFWGTSDAIIYAASFGPSLGTLTPVTAVSSALGVNGLTSSAAADPSGSKLTIFCERVRVYNYAPHAQTNIVSTATCTALGAVTSLIQLLRSVGLASKAFTLDDTVYVMLAYGGTYQPTYFLSDSVGNLVAKLAYSNGGGYSTSAVLPSVSINVNTSTAMIGYLFKDLLTSVNKNQGVANVNGIYSQTGVNLVTWDINSSAMPPAEIGNNLHLGGGFLSMYDGTRPVEHGFHVWPEDVALYEIPNVVNVTGDTSNTGSLGILSVSSLVGVFPGSTVSGAGVDAGSIIVSINTGASSITLDRVLVAGGAPGSALTITSPYVGAVTNQPYYYQVTYEWTDAQGNTHRSAPSVPAGIVTTQSPSSVVVNVPKLRLTAKNGASKVRIVIYRWSAGQENYYEVTSITSPVLNDSGSDPDSIAFGDTLTDAQILGNQLIYTTGGVIENIAYPAVSGVTLFKSRLFAIDAEDKNLLWYSKQVIQGVPVEPSDLFTQYIAPTAGAQGSTGPNTAISAMDDKLIIFKRDALYYMTGTGPDNTGANNDFSEPNYITSTAGCTNAKSIVFTPQGLMFQSDKGIWLLGRDLSTNYIGAPVEGLTDGSTVLAAVNVPGTNQVRFTLDSGITVMYDYYYGQWGTFVGMPAISSTLYQNLHTFVNSLGQVYQETVGSYLDGSSPVLMSFTTGWMSLAGLQGFERAYFFYLLGTYITPHKLSIGIAYDFDPSVVQTSVITPDNYNPPYGLEPGPFGSGDPYGGASNVEQWRVFLQQQKCQSFQITVTEIFDPSFGTIAGAGLTLSGINLVVGVKKGYNAIRAARSVG